MASMYGEKLRLSVFGQSHSEAIGVVIDGIPAGVRIDMGAFCAFMAKRSPGKNEYSTKRRENDEVHFVSGLVDGVTCGAPLCAIIYNENMKSKDYDNIKDIPRPSHADFTAQMRFGGFQDVAGGGHFSGRLTAPLCAAGAIAIQLLAAKGITIGAHIYKLAGIHDAPLNMVSIDEAALKSVSSSAFPVYDEGAGEAMKAAIEDARMNADSVGGVIECVILGVQPGVGAPMFDGIENKVAQAVFAIPAIKGIEFGNGFESADLQGSQNNDSFYMYDDVVRTRTNNHGGILGGISSGMPIVFRAAVKPTPSIGIEQDSISLSKHENTKLKIEGRHDPCIVPRAIPCIEAAAALAIINLL